MQIGQEVRIVAGNYRDFVGTVYDRELDHREIAQAPGEPMIRVEIPEVGLTEWLPVFDAEEV